MTAPARDHAAACPVAATASAAANNAGAAPVRARGWQRFRRVGRQRLAARRIPLHAALLALLLTLPALWVGWQTDDFANRNALLGVRGLSGLALRMMDLCAGVTGKPEHIHAAMDNGDFPWWTYERLRLMFWRPLSALTLWLDYRLWPNIAPLMHLHSLLWFGLAVYVAGLIYRRLLGPTWVAGLATLFFAVDDGHGLAAGWLANRYALLAAALGYLALLLHDKWRRDVWRPGAVLAPLLFALALLAGESGLGAGAYLFAYAAVLERGRWRKRLLTFLPYALVASAWGVAYHTLGYGAAGSALYNDAGSDPVSFLRVMVERAPILLVGQWSLPPADIVFSISAESLRQLWLTSWPRIVLVAALVAPLVWRSRTARFWTVGMLLSLVPACSALPSNRLLFFVGLGALGLIAQFLGALARKPVWLPRTRWYQWPALLIALSLVAVHGVYAPAALSWRSWSVVLAGREAVQMIDCLPEDAELTQQDLILVNPPNMFGPSMLTWYRQGVGSAMPAHTRVLALGILSMNIHRPDARTLVVRPRRGFFPPPGIPDDENFFARPRLNFGCMHQNLARLYRDDAHPLRVGEEVALTGVTVTVTRLTDDGRPAEAAFRFDVPLEDPSLRWIYCADGKYLPFPLPGVGDTIHLRPAMMPVE